MKPTIESKKIKTNYAPVYCALYPRLAEVFQKHGYALSIHGSLARDFDLVALPWGETISTPEEVIKEVEKEFVIERVGEVGEKNHGRQAYTISIVHGECAIDLSFYKTYSQAKKEGARETIEALEKALPDIDDGIHPDTGLPEYLEYNKGITKGRNECRALILSLITSLKEE